MTHCPKSLCKLTTQSRFLKYIFKSTAWFSVQSLPEPDHLSQHNPKRREDSRGQGDRPSQMLRCTFSKVHGLYVHADSCSINEDQHLCWEESKKLRLNVPAFMPIRTREMMIISNDLAALLVNAKRAPDMRKTLFSSKHFFLQMTNRENCLFIVLTFINVSY